MNTPFLNTRFTFFILAFIILIPQTKAQIPAYIPNSGLLSYMPFNGSAADEKTPANSLISNTATLTTDRFFQPNKAYQFNGSSGNFMKFNNSNMPLGSTPRTLSMWVYFNGPHTTGETSTIFGYGQQSGSTAMMTGLYLGTVRFMAWSEVFDVTYSYSTNTWYHLLFTYDGMNVKTYVNNVLIGSAPKSWSTASSSYFVIGTRPDCLNSFFNGKIDEIAVWNRVLTNTEIADVYNSCSAQLITQQPTNQTIPDFQSTAFSVNTMLTGVTYQWQQNLGSGFVNLSNGGNFSGVTNRVLTVSNVNADLHNSKYRCVLSTAVCSDTSQFATLSVTRFLFKNVPYYIPESGLLAWYPFNGNAVDESGNGNNGIVYGSTLTTDRNNISQRAYYFNGTSARIKVPGTSKLQAVNFTINAWVKQFSSPGKSLISRKIWQTGGNEQYQIDLGNVKIKRNSFCTTGTGWQNMSMSVLPDSAVWNFISVSYDGRYIKYYKNTILQNVTDLLTSQNMDTCLGSDLNFGASYSGLPAYFNGMLDDISLYSRALTQLEISNIYGMCGQNLVASEPVSDTVNEEDIASFKILPNDSNVSFHWQRKQNGIFVNLYNLDGISGVNSNTLIISDVSMEEQGAEFRCIITNLNGCKDSSNVVKLTVIKQYFHNKPLWLPADSLVAWYPFNGNARDESGNGNNGIVKGATLSTDRFNVSNKSYYFNGMNGYIKIPYSGSLKTPVLSINLWVMGSAVDSNVILCKRNIAGSSNEQYELRGNGFSVKRNSNCESGNGWNHCNVSDTIGANNWTFISIVYDGINMLLYKNTQLIKAVNLGILQGMDTCMGAELLLGRASQEWPRYFQGYLDDISIYSKALSITEMIKIYGMCGETLITTEPADQITDEGKYASFQINTAIGNLSYKWHQVANEVYTPLADSTFRTGTTQNKLELSNVPASLSKTFYSCIVTNPMGCTDTSVKAMLTVNKIIKNIPKWLPDSGLVAWYPFNGNADDESGNGNNGLVTGAILGSDRMGAPNKAYLFNGLSDKIMVNYRPSLKTPVITVNVWVKPAKANAGQIMVKRNWTSGANEQYSIHSSNLYIKRGSQCLQTQGWKSVNYTRAPSANNWSMITMSYDGKFLKYYLNGVLTDINNLLTTAEMDTCMGAEIMFGVNYSNSPNWFDGYLDDISIYKRALNQDEITEIYTNCIKVITLQPADALVNQGGNYLFKVKTQADSVKTFLWQADTGNTVFTALSNGAKFNGVNTNTLTVNNITGNMDGYKFRCIVSSTDNCPDTTRTATLNVQTVGVEHTAFYEVNMYPNPVNETLYIQYNGMSEPESIHIFDVTGKRIENAIEGFQTEQGRAVLQLNLSPNIYFIQIHTGEQVVQKKIIVIRN